MNAGKDSPRDQGRTGVQHLEAQAHNEDQRLDNFLLGRLKGVPRTLVYRIIRKGEVRINGKRARADTRVHEGDSIRVPPLRVSAAGEAGVVSPELGRALRAAILYEDEQIMVLNKPSGMPVHAGTGSAMGVIEALRGLFPALSGLELVHRLDKGTSGCLLLAKTGKARRALMQAFREREVGKRYHALVAGQWPQRLTRMDLPLQRLQARGGDRRVETDAQGKPAATTFRVLRRFRDATLVEACPETGRTHQIRVHASEAGHPLLGDDKYQTPASAATSGKLGARRLCLHAHGLEFLHPGSGRRMHCEAPYDEGFTRLLESLAPMD